MPENKESKTKTPPISADVKKPTEPAKALGITAPSAAAKAVEPVKAASTASDKETAAPPKTPATTRPIPTTDAKKPAELPKAFVTTQADTRPVDQKKPVEAPKTPSDAKAPATADAKKPTEPAKATGTTGSTPAAAKAVEPVKAAPTASDKETAAPPKTLATPQPIPTTDAKKPTEPPKAPSTTQADTRLSDQKKATEAPKTPSDAKAPATAADTKKPTEAAKVPGTTAPSATTKATEPVKAAPTASDKETTVPPKTPTTTQPIPAAESKKPSEPPKAPSTAQANTRLVDQKKPAEAPKTPGDAKTTIPAETQSPAEKAKAVGDAKAIAVSEPETGLPKGMRITQVFADRLEKPDEKALKDLPIPKEGEGFSIRLHPDYLFEFLDHPFSINREVADYKDLYDSIKANGINEPVKARPREGGGLELLSGHRRHDIAKQLNYPVPVVIVQEDDDSARIEVVDGNLHRQDIPTSELARAAKMKMEALARKAGRRSKMDQLTGPSKRTDQIVAEDMGMSRNQVNRLVRIDALVPELKQQVDEKKLPFNTAVELSFLKPEEQGKVVDFIKKEQMVPSLVQATQLKEASRAAQAAEKAASKAAPLPAKPISAPATEKKPTPAPVDEKKIASIIKPKTEPEQKYTFTSTELKEYFPGDRLPSTSEVKRKVFDALDLQKRALERRQAKEALKEGMKTPAR